jgi:hypothetical protein
MAPVLAFNTREGRDVSRTEAVGLARDREKNEKRKTQVNGQTHDYEVKGRGRERKREREREREREKGGSFTMHGLWAMVG